MAREKIDTLEKFTRLVSSRLSPDGRFELPDSTPMEVPTGYRMPPSTLEMVRDLVRREMSNAAEQGGYETFEEANDFDVDDDSDGLPYSGYELVDMVPEGPKDADAPSKAPSDEPEKPREADPGKTPSDSPAPEGTSKPVSGASQAKP